MWTSPVLLDAARPPRSRRSGRVLLALGLIALVGTTVHWRHESAALSVLELAVRDAQRPVPRVVERSDPAIEARRRWIERELNLPWPALFEAVETARTPAIRLNAFEAGASTGQVLLQGQARRLADVLDLAERLADRALENVTIRSHQPLADAAERPLGFQLGARWYADTTTRGSAAKESAR
jgi:hypothetical protein